MKTIRVVAAIIKSTNENGVENESKELSRILSASVITTKKKIGV